MTPLPADAAESLYSTARRTADCTVLDKARAGEGEWSRWRCAGPSGAFAFISEDDQRTAIAYGKPGLTHEWQRFAGFNSVGKTIEWRQEGDAAPFAAIQRWSVSGAAVARRQILIVSTVADAGEQSCMVGLIDASANPGTNRLARRTADEKVRGFRCDRDRPRYHGNHAGAPAAL